MSNLGLGLNSGLQAFSFFRGEPKSDMPRIMMTLGEMEFSIDTLAYNALSRDASWKWAEQERAGKPGLLQYTGKSRRTIKLDGEAHGKLNESILWLDKLPDMLGDKAEPQLLVLGNGDVLGYWVVTAFTDNAMSFYAGGAARHKTFSLTIQHYADDILNP